MTTSSFIFLQAAVTAPAQSPALNANPENYFTLLMKGGWILLPIALLLILAIYVIIERWVIISYAKSKDPIWLMRINDFIKERRIDSATSFCSALNSSSAKVIRSGLENIEQSDLEEIQETMQVEARQEVSRIETRMNYLGITAAIAPMLGFLGTIFGVIKIFYNISVTNDLNIANISDGLYQKMICSGAGLFVGIIAYAGYYTLNGKIDRLVNQIEKDSNDVLKFIRQYKKKSNE